MTLAKRAQAQMPSKGLAYDPRTENQAVSRNGLATKRIDQAREFEQASIRDLQTRLARQNLAAREMRERIQALSARAADADKRYAELDDELNVAREEILLQQDDKHSLQRSLDLLACENAQLSNRLVDSDDALKKAHCELEREKATLRDAEFARNSLTAALDQANANRQSDADKLKALTFECKKLAATLDAAHQRHLAETSDLKSLTSERDKLAASLHKTHRRYQSDSCKLKTLQVEHNKLADELNQINEKHQAEIGKLKSRLDGSTSRAAVAENVVARLRQMLHEKVNLLQTSVQAKDCEIYDLEQAHAKLVDGAKMLLGFFAMRDATLVRADRRMEFLARRVTELEAELYPPRGGRTLKELGDQAQGDLQEHQLARVTVDRPNAVNNRPECNADDDFIGDRRHSHLPPLFLTETILTATITF